MDWRSMASLILTGAPRTVVSTTNTHAENGVVHMDREFPAGTDPQEIKRYIDGNGGRVVVNVVLLESEGLMHSGPKRLVVPGNADLNLQAEMLPSDWTAHVSATRFITLAS